MKFLITLKSAILILSFFLFTHKALAEKKIIKEYGIVILLSEECANKAALLNKQIAAKLPDLQNPLNQWHITLYHAAFSESYFNELKNTIATLPLEPMELYFDKIYNSGDRWIDFGVKKNNSLAKLHGRVVKASSRYRQREIRRVHDLYSTLTDKKKAQVAEYGVHNVYEDYKPHMTLFYQYPANRKLGAVANEIAKTTKPVRCKAAKIALGELEYNGNISKIIYEVNFPTK